MAIQSSNFANVNLSVNTSSLGTKIANGAEAVGRTARTYAWQTSAAEENYIYQDVQQIKQVQDVASLVFGDHERNRISDHINRFNTGDWSHDIANNVSDAMHSIGNGRQDTVVTQSMSFNDYSNVMGLNASQQTIDNMVLGYRPDGSQVLGQHLNSTQAQMLFSNGTAAIPGLNITIPQGFQSTFTQANSERAMLNNFMEGSANQKVAAFHEIKSKSVQSISQFEGLKGEKISFSGTVKDCVKADKLLSEKILNCTDPSLRAKLTQELQALRQYQKTFAGVNPQAGLSQQQIAGLNAIARGAMGSDFYRGVNFYKAGGKITATALRTVTTTATRLGLAAGRVFTGTTAFVGKTFIREPHVVNRLNAMNDGMKNFSDKTKLHMKENRNARKTHTTKELRRSRRLERGDRRFERESKRLNKLHNDVKTASKQAIKDANANGKSFRDKNGKLLDSKKKYDKLAAREKRMRASHRRKSDRRATGRDRLERRALRRQARREQRLARWKAFKSSKFGKFATGVGNFFMAPFRLINAARKYLNPAYLLKKLGKRIWIAIAPILGKFVLIGGAVAFIVILIVFFGSSLDGTHLADKLENQNFAQYIVDITQNKVARTSMIVMKNDATHQYNMLQRAVGQGESDGLDWYKRATTGRIGKIVAMEDHNIELSSMNANIVPITNMMHYRYQDEIVYDTWTVPMAYEMYMYIVSRDVYNVSYEDKPNCPEAFNYAANTLIWDENLKTTNRIAYDGDTNTWLLCENEYCHGYSKSQFNAIAEAKRKLSEGLNDALAALNGIFGTNFVDEAALKASQGVWKAGYHEYKATDTGITAPETERTYIDILSDAKGTCTHYMQFRWDGNAVCGIEEHKHDSAPAYSGSRYGEKSTNGCYKWTKHTSTYRYDECEDTSSSKWGYHSEKGRTETDAQNKVIQYYNHWKEGKNEWGEWDYVCTKNAHTHTPWSADNHGCYATAYVCLGHCGGHVQPVIDVEVATTYENLAEFDNTSFKLVNGKSVISQPETELLIGDIGKFCYNWDMYQTLTMYVANFKWFHPNIFTCGPGYADMLFHQGVKWGARAVDWITGAFANGIKSLLGFDDMSSMEDVSESDLTANAEEDDFEFPGWWIEDDSGNVIINPEPMETLTSIYGEQYENGDTTKEPYAYAKEEMWGTLGDMAVYFSDGMYRNLSYEQEQAILKAVERQGIPQSSERYKMIARALDACGKYWIDYDKSPQSYTLGNNGVACPEMLIDYIVTGNTTGKDGTSVESGSGSYSKLASISVQSYKKSVGVGGFLAGQEAIIRHRYRINIGDITEYIDKEVLTAAGTDWSELGQNYFIEIDDYGVHIVHYSKSRVDNFGSNYLPHLN